MTTQLSQENKINIIRYSVGVEEYSLALAMAGNEYASRAILEGIHQDLDTSKINELLTSASHSLIARGLCQISSGEKAILEKRFGQAIRTVVEYEELLYINVGTEETPLELNVHINPLSDFCAHWNKANLIHLLEYGQHRILTDYLMDNMGGTLDGGGESTLKIENEIPISILPQSIKPQEDKLLILSSLIERGWTKDQAEILGEDLITRISRGSFVRIKTKSTDTKDQLEQAPRTGFFFLRGSKHNWVFTFSSLDSTAVGHAYLVNREQFKRLLTEFLK